MAKLTPDERIQYLQAIWETFQHKAGTQRDMSSAEYHVAAGWLNSGIPLFAVLRGIEDFNGTPRRLEAVRGPVDQAVAYWKRSQTL